jgi:hypothetical protein
LPTDDRYTSAVDLLRTAANRAKRHTVAFPPSFVIADEPGQRPPMACMIQGGRGGEIRFKTYLTITMMATKTPFDLRTSPTPAGWARLLALPDDTGPRRVTTGLRWLRDNRFITLQPRPGRPPMITLLDPSGNNEKYARPSGQGRYVGIPVELWINGWILRLSSTALALLLVLIEHQGGHNGPRYLLSHRRERYALSPDTWTKATKELVNHGLLTVKRTPQGGDFDYRRLRNTYRVDLSALKSTYPR